jgi:hypothetical protein
VITPDAHRADGNAGASGRRIPSGGTVRSPNPQ